MRHIMICSLASLLLIGCGPAEFSSSSSQAKLTTTPEGGFDGAGGAIGQEGTDGANGNLNGEDPDGAGGSLPPMTTDEVIALITGALAGQDPSVARLEGILETDLDPLRCYISGSGGHGIDMCMADTSPVQHLSPRAEEGDFIEIKGNQLCVPLKLLLAKRALFATAVTGSCL